MKKKETPKLVSSSMQDLIGNVMNGVEKAKAKAEVLKQEIQESKKEEDTLREADRIKAEQKKAEQDRLALKKATRNQQRSVKFDEVTLIRLDLVKKIWKKNGVVRPAADDIIFKAVNEYLDKHYPETKDKAETLAELNA